jgi:hypothetical protein
MESKAQVQTDYLSQLREIGNQFESSDPRFKKYLDKAIQIAQPRESPDGNPVLDQTGYAKYMQIVEAVQIISKMANTINEVRKKLQEGQVQIVQTFNRIKVISEQLTPFIDPTQSAILLNDDTRELLDKFEEAYNEMNELIDASKDAIEVGFDKVNEAV